MRLKIVTLLALGAALALPVAPGAMTATVGARADITNDHFANNEESLGMSSDGRLLAGAWNDWEYNDGCGFSYSTDGGDHWAPETFAPFTAFTNDPDVPGANPKFAIAGDPSVAYNPKFGRFDVVCQAFGSATGNQIQLLSTTFDPAKANPDADVNFSYGEAVGGAPAWAPLVAVVTGKSNGSQKGSNGKVPDHESILVDTGRGPGHHFGRLFVAWAEFSGSGRSPINIAYSDDDGAHWTGPIRVSDAGHQFDQDARPAIGPDGTVYVTFTNGPNESSLKNNFVMIAASHDGGNTWSSTHTVAPIVSPVPGQLPNSQYRVFSDAWSTVDQRTGSVVVVYNDAKTGPSQLYAVHNRPGSLSRWSTPKRLKPTSREQFFPWISSAPNGRVDVVYYDRACDPADAKNCVTLSSSTDSGATWSSVALLSKGFDGDRFQACLAFVDPQPDCGTFFLGDYIAVVSNDTKAQALWTGNGRHAMDAFSGRVTFP
jgi:hypothetical protein